MDINTIYYFLFGFLLGFLHACVAFYFYLRRLHRHLSERLEELREAAKELVRSVERVVREVEELVEEVEKGRYVGDEVENNKRER